MKQKSFLKWMILPLFSLFLFNCSKDEIYINLGSGTGSNDQTGDDKGDTISPDKTFAISFNAVMESMNLTKSIFTFPQGRYATVFVFNEGTSPNGIPLANANYTTKSSGILSPVATPIYLSNGEYNFYSVATNSTTNKTPTFTNGVSSSLSNGVDYLWWSTPRFAVSASTANINIVYSHSCTQVVIKMTAGNGVTINSIDSARITPPVPSSTMDLATGQIPSATQISTTGYMNMGISQDVCQATMLPLKTSSPLTAVFKIKINNEAAPRTFQVNIPVPGDALLPGDSYLFSAVVNSTTITFPKVSVIGWVVVNESGEPLYPSEID